MRYKITDYFHERLNQNLVNQTFKKFEKDKIIQFRKFKK